MRLALFVTCLVDLMRPSIGFASLRLLESAGLRSRRAARPDLLRSTCLECRKSWPGADLARQAIAELEGYDYVVIPSGSCADQIRNVYPQLLGRRSGLVARGRRRSPRAATN